MKKVLLLTLLIPALALAAAPPRKVLSLAAAANEMLNRFGATGRLAAIDDYGRVAAGTETIESIGKNAALSREAVKARGIDGAIVWNYQTDAIALCRDLGIPCLALEPLRLGNYTESARKVAQFLELENPPELKIELPAPPSGTPGPKVYFELYTPGRTAGEASYIGDLLEAAGAQNIGKVLKVSGLLGAEAVIAAQPDVIFYIEGFGDPKEIARRPGFKTLPAVRNGRLHAVPRRYTVAGISPEEAVTFLKEKIEKL